MQTKLKLANISIELLKKGKYQPRNNFPEQDLRELAASIKENGLLQPIVVKPTCDKQYEIIAGERRWRAAQYAGLTEILCLVKNCTEEQTAAAALIENIQRQELNPVEEANAYKKFIEVFDYTQEELAKIVGKSRAHISNLLRLLKLNDIVQLMIVNGELSLGHAKILLSVESDYRLLLAKSTVENGWSVRKLELEAKKSQQGDYDKPSKVKDSDADLLAIESALSQYIGSQVNLVHSSGKGTLSIKFQNLDVLEGIFQRMGFKYEQ